MNLWTQGREKSPVQFSCSFVSDSLPPHGLQHARPPCSSPAPRVYSNSCPLSRWCHPTISSSVVPYCSHLQSFPTSGSFQMSQFFASGSQRGKIPWRRNRLPTPVFLDFPGGSDSKESACNARNLGSIPGLGRSPGEGHATHSSILPGEFHGQRSLGSYSPWGHKESDKTEQISTRN